MNLHVRNRAFTLVELLTVIAIVAVLASLLLTALMSGKKRSRAAVCTFNLHQICLAVDMYVDEFSQRPNPEALAANKYVPARASFLCPEDKTGNWGPLVRTTGSLQVIDLSGNVVPPFQPPRNNTAAPVKYSYLLDPLDWDESMWKRLMLKGSLAGIAACQLHGLGTQENPSVFNFSGLVLRGQRDGSVVRRQVFWGAAGTPGNSGRGGDSPMPSGLTFNTSASGMYFVYLSPYSPLQFFLDEPEEWLLQWRQLPPP